MSYNKKIIITIFLLVAAAAALILLKFLAIDIKYTPINIDNIQTELPYLGTPLNYQENGWAGKISRNHSRTQWAMVLTRDTLPKQALETFFPPDHRIKPLKLNKNAVFGVQARGKSFRRYIYLIRYRDSIHWLESGSKRSTLIHIKTMADHMMKHLSIDGIPFVNDAESIIVKTTAFVSPRYSQSFGFFLLIITGVLLLTFGIILVVFYFGIREPSVYTEHPLRIFRGVTIKMNLVPLRIQMIDGTVALMPDGFLVYYFKKNVVRIHFREIRDLSQLKVGTTALFKQHYIQFIFPEHKSVHLPGIKKSQKTKKMTLYLKKSQIRQMMLETDFPYKDRLLYTDV